MPVHSELPIFTMRLIYPMYFALLRGKLEKMYLLFMLQKYPLLQKECRNIS